MAFLNKTVICCDRASDVQTAIHAKGTGILIPFENEPGREEKVKRIIYVAKNFLYAAAYIRKRCS